MKLFAFFFSGLLSGLFYSTSVLAASPRFSPDRIVVKVKAQAVLPHYEAARSVQHLFGRIYVVNVKNLAAAEAFFAAHPSVERVEKDYQSEKQPVATPVFTSPMPSLKLSVLDILGLSDVFNDPKASDQWALRSAVNSGVSVIDAYESFPGAGQPITVAIIDTGIEYTHDDLQANIWVNTQEIPGNGIDDDGNGYIDDIYGINTLVRDATGKATSEIADTSGHGTHVAGIMGAVQNNGRGVAGIARSVKLMGIKTVPDEADEKDVDVAEAMIYAARNGAKIINCSFGKRANEGGQLIPETLQYLNEEFGVLVIAASGNDGEEVNDSNQLYPATHLAPNLLVVASTGSNGRISFFSNYGTKYVHVAAPGASVLSTYLGGGYSFLSGTSMASPNAAGVAAQVLSHHPELTAVQLKSLLMDTVTPVPSLSGKVSTGGRVDLKRALEKANKNPEIGFSAPASNFL